MTKNSMLKLGRLSLGKVPRIAVSFRDGTSPVAIRRARDSGLDIAELRIDLFRSRSPRHVLKEIAKFKSVPTIATIRSEVEGGRWHSSEEKRFALFQAVIPHVDAVDIELSSKFILGPVVQAARRAKKLAIISYHNFEITPRLEELNELRERAESLGADIVKIAVFARSAGDVRLLASYTAQNAARHIVTVAMGKAGAMSRVVFPALGSLITYAHLGKATAPGQLDLKTTAALVKSRAGGKVCCDL